MRAFTIALATSIALAQAPAELRFESASVKIAAPLRGGGIERAGTSWQDSQHIKHRDLSMKTLLMAAYDLPSWRIEGPAWIDSERYDIAATLPAGATRDRVPEMLRNLLVDRFKLMVRRETRDRPVFDLTAGKNGPEFLGPGLRRYFEDPFEVTLESGFLSRGPDGKTRPLPGGTSIATGGGRRTVKGRKQSMAQLATSLTAEFGRPVNDRTGMAGDFDYTLEFSTREPRAGDPPVLQDAVRDQLGLGLVEKLGPVEILVVDGGEKTPTEN